MTIIINEKYTESKQKRYDCMEENEYYYSF